MTRTRTYRSVLLPAILTLGALALSACGGSSSSSGSDAASAAPASAAPTSSAIALAGTAWVLATYSEPNGTQAPAVTTGNVATLTFGADGALSGSTGCNRIVGAYKQDGADLSIQIGPMTKMACPPDVTAQETAVLANLAKVASFTSSTSLVLMTADGSSLLTYTPGLAGLAGTSWQATGVNNGKGGLVGTAATGKVTATFGEDGTVSGSGGCNTYSGSYTTTAPDQISFGAIAATAMACEDAEVTQTEQDYFAALANVTTYQIDGNTLTLRDASGAMQVVYALTP
jgi:heat shock protein HslJ